MLDFEPELEARIAAQAQERRLSVPQYLHGLITRVVAEPKPEDLGWPAGYFDETYGASVADLLTRLPQGNPEAREPLQ
jgi:hypothetical protein